jgi:hypothetical protein
VQLSGDSIEINEESDRILRDEDYRKNLYPKEYTWPEAIELLKKQELKKAFWYLLNLYLINDQNKELVIKSMLTYDNLFKMDKVMVNTFYAYGLLDPEIGAIVDGQSEITAPHILERKLNALKEILFFIDKYRAERQDP